MLLYFQKIFSISRPFELTKRTARIFYQVQQLENIKIYYIFDQKQYKLAADNMIKGVVVEDNGPEKVKFFLRFLSSYFINRTNNNGFYG